MSRYLNILVIMLFLNPGCHYEKLPKPTPSFYHWKTSFDLGDIENQYLSNLGVRKLYVRFFDVDWDAALSEPVPVAAMLSQSDNPAFETYEIVPVIFITNRTFQNLDVVKIPDLAQKTAQKIITIFREAIKEGKGTPASVQFDCDWTSQTAYKYFSFLRSVKTNLNYLLSGDRGISIRTSATIRLHQLKYWQQTGVPPVEKGMLMFYNTGNIEDWESENSILQISDARAYMPSDNLNYSLELDFALPVFHWGLVFRDGLFHKIINDLDIKILQDTSRFIPLEINKDKSTRFRVLRNTFLEGHYLVREDLIKIEETNLQVLFDAVSLLRSNINRFYSRNKKNIEPFELAFYHLDAGSFEVFSHEEINKILDRF